MRSQLDHMVVSVGPYMYQSEAQRGISSDARSCDRASPPHRILQVGEPFQPVSMSMRHVIGVACMIVAWQSRKTWCIATASALTAEDTSSMRAPTMSGRKSSSAEMSKQM